MGETVLQFPDRRVGTNTRYSMADFALSTFSVFFMQRRSFLKFDRTMGRTKGRHSAPFLNPHLASRRHGHERNSRAHRNKQNKQGNVS